MKPPTKGKNQNWEGLNEVGSKEDKLLYDRIIIKLVQGSIKTEGEYLNEILLVSRIIYCLLNRVDHMKVEAHLAPPPHHCQFLIWIIFGTK
jgi:hypothetical protein